MTEILFTAIVAVVALCLAVVPAIVAIAGPREQRVEDVVDAWAVHAARERGQKVSA